MYSFSWTTEGFSTFFEVSKLPLAIASLSLPLGTVSAVIHRSAQTAKQIELSLELSRFKDFKEHREAFLDEITALLSDSWTQVSVGHLYRVLFPQSVDRHYKPVIPHSWNALFEMLTVPEHKKRNADYFSIDYWNALNNDSERSKLLEEKRAFVKDFSDLIYEADTTIKMGEPDMDVYERNGINDEEEFVANLGELARDCASMFRKLTELASVLLSSHTYHFMSSEQVSVLVFFSRSEVNFKTELNSDFEEFFGQERLELKGKVVYMDSQERLVNGDLVALTFRVKNVLDF